MLRVLTAYEQRTQLQSIDVSLVCAAVNVTPHCLTQCHVRLGSS